MNNNINQNLIADAGGIGPLIDLVRNGTDEQKEMATKALRILAWNNKTNQNLIADAGGIGPLIDLVRNGTDEQKEYATGALRNLARTMI